MAHATSNGLPTSAPPAPWPKHQAARPISTLDGLGKVRACVLVPLGRCESTHHFCCPGRLLILFACCKSTTMSKWCASFLIGECVVVPWFVPSHCWYAERDAPLCAVRRPRRRAHTTIIISIIHRGGCSRAIRRSPPGRVYDLKSRSGGGYRVCALIWPHDGHTERRPGALVRLPGDDAFSASSPGELIEARCGAAKRNNLQLNRIK